MGQGSRPCSGKGHVHRTWFGMGHTKRGQGAFQKMLLRVRQALLHCAGCAKPPVGAWNHRWCQT